MIDEFSTVLNNFLSAGVKGVRLRGSPSLLVNENFQNESIDTSTHGFMHLDYGFYTHTQTEYLDELGPVLKKWRDIVKEKSDNGPFMLAEELKTLEPFKVNSSLIIDLPQRSHVFAPYKQLSASQLRSDLNGVFAFLENKYWALWKVCTNFIIIYF